MGKTQSKSLAARHGRRTAWARHGMCELAFKSVLLRPFKCPRSDICLQYYQIKISFPQKLIADYSTATFVTAAG
jgi:hypothetical protein